MGASLAQGQSTGLVNQGSWVQSPQEAFFGGMNDLFSCVSLVDLPVKMLSQLAGFEPTRAEPIGFQVQRLNHSATTAHSHHISEKPCDTTKKCGDAGDRTPGLSHAKRTLYH